MSPRDAAPISTPAAPQAAPASCTHCCSHVDPARNRLFFKRFLNEDLQTVPDIDLDFARDIRAALILQVYETYGQQHAALVCSFATYHLRSAVRDLGKVLGLPPAAVDKLARLSEGGKASSVRAELNHLPEFEGQAEGPLWDELMQLAEQIDGFPRHVGQHVGGMIISSRPLVELVPVQPAAMEGRYICQWDKDSCDDARFVKIDFLALGMLSLVEECLELIWQSQGTKVDLSSDLRYDDKAVYDVICKGDTVGMFQIESRAQIQMLPRTQPRTLDDLAVQVAIVRPGPIVGGAVNPYVHRRERMRADPSYTPKADHPMLDELLADTLGVVLYQDQVLEVAMKMGGFTPGQADQFRRAMSRRRSREAMESFRAAFLQGAQRNGVAEQAAAEIFDKLRGFSEFGFPKSHAYAFAVLAYQSAWLRHYYAAEYYCALLNNQPMGFYAPHVLIGDAKRHDLKVLPVTINGSGVKCTPASNRILLGLTTVRGLSVDLAQAIVDEREAHGPYRSLSDLLRRTELPRPLAERLIAVGALSDFGLGRRELLWQLGLLLPGTFVRAAPPTKVNPAKQGIANHAVGAEQAPPLQGPGDATSSVLRIDEEQVPARCTRQPSLDLPTDQDMVTLPDMTEWERMVADYGLLGLSPRYHPLGLLRPHIAPNIKTADQLHRAYDGARARAAGLVVCRQRPGTAKGYVFLLLEDETGLVNVVVRPDLYEARRSVIRGEPYVCIEGTVQQRSGTLNLLADHVEPLTRVPEPLLPRPPMRHPAPGGDPRAAAAAPLTQPVEDALHLATPASHDFH